MFKSNKYIKRALALVLACACISNLAFGQQDIQTSQYMFNGIYINPAYAGYKENLNIHSFYRDQWTGISGAPKSFSIAVDAIANKGNVGLALQITTDKIGAQRTNTAYASYAYRLKMNDDGSSRLALGLGVGVVQTGIDGALLNPDNPEPFQPLGFQSAVVPDARVGVFFSNEKYYAGISTDNLISQFIEVDRFAYIPQPKPHYYLTAGALFGVSTDLAIRPSFLIKEDRGGPTSLDLNAFLIYSEKIWVGASYRTAIKVFDKSYLQDDLLNSNSMVAAVELFPKPNIRIGYAYDFSDGPLRTYSSGSHEISIAFSFNRRNVRMLTPRVF